MNLLSRINLSIPIDKLLDEIAPIYQLGEIKAFEYIPIGYEDLNIKLETSKGKYVIKIFSKHTPFTFIQNYIQTMLLFAKAGIPTPTLVKTKKGYLYSKNNSSKKIYLCVMKFFEGKSFNEIMPTQKDLLTITAYMAKIHTFKFKIHSNYDSWGPSHLLEEFPKKEQYLKKDDLNLIKPIIEKLSTVDFSKFRRCTIHGALEKQNILKDKQGNYCLLDLGCLDFNAAVIDLAIFLAAFCLNPSVSLEKNKKIYRLIVQEYRKTNALNTLEMNVLPLLIQASYVAYILTANYLMTKKHDSSTQTKNFLSLGKNGLRALKMLY